MSQNIWPIQDIFDRYGSKFGAHDFDPQNHLGKSANENQKLKMLQ